MATASLAASGAAAQPSVGALSLVPKELPGLRAEVATLIMQGLAGGAVDLALAARLEPVGDDAAVDLTLEISGDALLASIVEPADRLMVELYVYVVAEDGAVVGHSAQQVEIPVEGWGERLSAAGLRVADRVLLLQPGHGPLSIRALVSLPAAGRFGMAVTELDLAPAANSLGRPRFEDLCADWITVARVAAGGSATSARPLWKAGERVSVAVPVPASWAGAAGEVVGLFRRESSHDVTSAATVRRDPTQLERFLVDMEVPGLESGIYAFSVRTGSDRGLESAPLEVWVLEEPVETCAWPQVMALARQRVEEVGPVLSDQASAGGSLRRRVRQGYRELLLRLGGGKDLESAVDELVDWERSVVEEDIQKNLKILLAAQLDVLRELAGVDPQSLLPLFKLHQSAYREHFLRRHFALAGHSRRIAETIVETGLEAVDPGADSTWAADALAGLAETADRHRMFAASQGLLERSIEIDPDNPQARLLLSMLYEKLGVHEAAAAHLEHLVAGAPALSHAWLRLAIVQRRLGRTRSSGRSLRRVIGQRPEPWILSLAYQTLVQELFEEGLFGEGLAHLEKAALLLPDDPALALARAYGLDRLGRTREAVEILKRPGPELEGSDSPRLHYAECAAELAERVDRRLRRAVTIRQPLLRRAIEATSP